MFKSMTRALRIVAAGAGLLGASNPAARHHYTAGQVWEYRTRPGDEGSLLKIQQVEADPPLAKRGPIYHISVIGFHLSNPQVVSILPHAPVSQQTLDASVIRLATTSAAFPDAAPGIDEWRQAKGGVFTIPVAEIIDILDQRTRSTDQ